MTRTGFFAKGTLGAGRISLLLAAVIAVSAPFCASSAQEPEGTPKPQAVSLYNLGLNAYRQGSPESAVIFFKRAVDLDPDLADAHYNLGVIYQSQKRSKEAIQRFQEVLRIKPGDMDAHFQLGLLFAEQGESDHARQELSSIPPSDSRFQDAQRKLAELSRPAQAVSRQPPAVYGQSQPAYASGISYGGGQPDRSPPEAAGGNAPWQAGATPEAAQPAVTPLQPEAAQGSTDENRQAQLPDPVPVLANTSLKVIARGFHAPAGLAFDRAGNLYIANFLTDTIDRISPDGIRTEFASGANLKGPIGITADAAGNLYVANYSGGNIARINPAGVSTVIATGFKKPYYLAFDRDGNLYVSQQEDSSVVRIALPGPIGQIPQ